MSHLPSPGRQSHLLRPAALLVPPDLCPRLPSRRDPRGTRPRPRRRGPARQHPPALWHVVAPGPGPSTTSQREGRAGGSTAQAPPPPSRDGPVDPECPAAADPEAEGVERLEAATPDAPRDDRGERGTSCGGGMTTWALRSHWRGVTMITMPKYPGVRWIDGWGY